MRLSQKNLITNFYLEEKMTKMTKITITLFLMFFASQKILSAPHFVSRTGGHIPPFTSWDNAATNIQAAIDVALTNDTVLVTNGIYNISETITPGLSCSNRVVIINNIHVKSVNSPEETIILGKGPDGSSAIRGVFISAGVLEGFTISNGHTGISGSFSDRAGGGVNMYIGDGIITNCIISGNIASAGGGGVYKGIVNNCTIIGNSADEGGGICESIVNNCTISGNSVDEDGGGILKVQSTIA